MQIPATYTVTRLELHRVAAHVIARARHAATGRFGLRTTPDGIGTPAFGPDVEVVRLAGARLVRERAGTGGASTAISPIAGCSLAELAAFAGVDLAPDFGVGDETPALGDVHAGLHVDPESAVALAAWFAFAGAVLDDALAELGSDASPSVVQVWPEHFDAAVDVAAAPGRRVNLGASPGDGFEGEPYLYVGPWDRDGLDDPFWNAPFGATRSWRDLAETSQRAEAAAFLVEGVRRVATP